MTPDVAACTDFACSDCVFVQILHVPYSGCVLVQVCGSTTCPVVAHIPRDTVFDEGKISFHAPRDNFFHEKPVYVYRFSPEG